MTRSKRGKKPADARLAPYPGLTIERGIFHVRHPITKQRASLGTKDFQSAVSLYMVYRKQWTEQVQDLVAEKIVAKLLELSNKTVPIKQQQSAGTTLAEYAKYIRTAWLDYNFDLAGKVIRPVKPRLLSNTKIAKRKGMPISERTASDYGQMIAYKIEVSDLMQFPLSTPREESVLKLRGFLSQWITQAPYYNNMTACISKIYQQAIREGLCVTNPTYDIEPLPTAGRKVYVPTDAYTNITSVMMVDRRQSLKTREWFEVDSEWEARACDMLYLVSGRPEDTLKFKDADFKITYGPHGRAGSLQFETGKTGTWQEIELNDPVMDLVEWFRAWKQQQGLVSQYLICYPKYIKKSLIGKPVSVKYLSGRWSECVVKAGYEASQYWLYDLRKKSLTDESRAQGKNDKGGHKTNAMREHYILDEVPVRSRATLAALPRK